MTVTTAVKYAWGSTHGVVKDGVSAQAIGETIEAIRERDGICTPGALVSIARSPEHPAHGLLEWDNEICGRDWRLDQARRIISAIRYVDEEGKVAPTPVFHHVKVWRSGVEAEGYTTLRVAWQDPAQYAFILKEALANLDGWRTRYALITDLPGQKEAFGHYRETLERGAEA